MNAARACRWHTADGYCGATPTRPFAGGDFCPLHTPAARAGLPELPPGPGLPHQQKGGQQP